LSKNPDNRTFGAWVRAWRIARGLSQIDCSNRAGWHFTAWSRLEREVDRQHDRSTVLKIAEVLGAPEELALTAAGYAPDSLRTSVLEAVPEKETLDRDIMQSESLNEALRGFRLPEEGAA
jgi:transcriptional regulator with XRE-family HTH domain